MKPARELTAAQLRARTLTLSDRLLQINDEFIAAGRGHERPSDIRGKTDLLSFAWIECADALREARDEQVRRLAWGGTLRPIPQNGY